MARYRHGSDVSPKSACLPRVHARHVHAARGRAGESRAIKRLAG